MLVGYFPNIAAHLISASVLSAPAAFIIAKVMVPEREQPLTRGDADAHVAVEDANLLDAAANGTTVGWQLAVNVAAMLLAFIALITMVNFGVSWLGQFFKSGSGLIQFNLMAIGVLLSLFAVARYGSPQACGSGGGCQSSRSCSSSSARWPDPTSAALLASSV